MPERLSSPPSGISPSLPAMIIDVVLAERRHGAGRVAYGRTMRIWGVIREHADSALAAVFLLALEAEIWLALVRRQPPPHVDRGRRSPRSRSRCAAASPSPRSWPCGRGSILLKQIAPGFDEKSTVFIVVGVFALYSLGANARGGQAWIGAALVAVITVQFIGDDGDRFMWGDVVFGVFIMGGPWLAGVVLRLRRARERRLEQEKAQAEAAIVDERQRIARELHDVIAHAIAVVVVQARGGRRMLDHDLADSRAGVRRHRAHGRAGARRDAAPARAAARDDDELARAPLPSLARIPDLAEQLRAAGLAGRARHRGRPGRAAARRRPLRVPDRAGGAHELAQARGARAARACASATERTRSSSRSSTTAAVARDGDGTGNGLVGLRERAAIVGGDSTPARATRAASPSARRFRTTASDDPRPARRRPGARPGRASA